MSRTVMPGSRPRLSRVHPAVRLIAAARTLYAGRAQYDEKTILCARETDVAKCMIVEVEWYIPPTAALAARRTSSVFFRRGKPFSRS